jgi:hypothetical protein
MDDLQVLINKLTDQLTDLEEHMADVKSNLNAAIRVSTLLKEESDSNNKQASLFEQLVQPESDKYANLNMTDAVMDALLKYPDSNGKEVCQELRKNSFKTNSKTLQRDGYIKLNKLKKKGKITSIKEDKGMIKYRVKEK